MSIRLMNAVWESSLPTYERFVALALADCADDSGRCWPSVETIAAKCGMSERGVRNCLRSLEGMGVLTSEQRPGRSTVYVLTYPGTRCPPEHGAPRNTVPPPRNDVPPTPEPGAGGAEPGAPRTIKNHKLTNNEPKEPSPDGRFGMFWDAYPKKVAKAAAEKAWAKLCPDQPLFDQIMSGLAAATQSESWNKDGGQFIPHAATWLNGKRWTDAVGGGGKHDLRAMDYNKGVRSDGRF